MDSKGYSSPKERLALSRRKAQARRVRQAKLRPRARQIGGMQWGVVPPRLGRGVRRWRLR